MPRTNVAMVTDVTKWLKQQERIETDPRQSGALELPTLSDAPRAEVELLTRDFAERTEFMRRQIARALGELQAAPDRSLPVLLAALDDSDPAVRACSSLALARFGSSAEPLLRQELAEPERHGARMPAVVGALKQISHLDVHALIDLLRAARIAPADPERVGETRFEYLARVLPEILATQEETGLLALVELVADPDEEVAEVAATALEHAVAPGGPAFAQRLAQQWLHCVHPDIEPRLLAALLATGAAGERQLLQVLRHEESAEKRGAAAEALADLPRVRLADWLVGHEAETNREVQTLRLRAVVHRLESDGDFAQAEPLLRQAVDDPVLREVLLESGANAMSGLRDSVRRSLIRLLIAGGRPFDSAELDTLLHGLCDAGPAASEALPLLEPLVDPSMPGSDENARALRLLRHVDGWSPTLRHSVEAIAASATDPRRNLAALALVRSGAVSASVQERIARELLLPNDQVPDESGIIEAEPDEFAPLLRGLGPERLEEMMRGAAHPLAGRIIAMQALPSDSPTVLATAREWLQSDEDELAIAGCRQLLESAEPADQLRAVQVLYPPPDASREGLADYSWEATQRAIARAPDLLLAAMARRWARAPAEIGWSSRHHWADASHRASEGARAEASALLMAALLQGSGSDREDLAQLLLAVPSTSSAVDVAPLFPAIEHELAAFEETDNAKPAVALIALLARLGTAEETRDARLQEWCRHPKTEIRAAALNALAQARGALALDEPELWRAVRDGDSEIVTTALRALEAHLDATHPSFQSWAEAQIAAQAPAWLEELAHVVPRSRLKSPAEREHDALLAQAVQREQQLAQARLDREQAQCAVAQAQERLTAAEREVQKSGITLANAQEAAEREAKSSRWSQEISGKSKAELAAIRRRSEQVRQQADDARAAMIQAMQQEQQATALAQQQALEAIRLQEALAHAETARLAARPHETVTLEKFEVTGSRIARIDSSPPFPVLPPFPWPPPRPTHRGKFGVEFPAELLGPPEQTLATLHARLVAALRDADPGFEAGLFGIPGGVVLLTRLERTDAAGKPLPGGRRWMQGKITPYSFGDLVARLFFERPGYFREVAFVVTTASLAGYGDQPLPDILDGGDMPADLGAEALAGRNVYVLVYAFERRAGGAVVPHATLSAMTHLSACGVLASLQ